MNVGGTQSIIDLAQKMLKLEALIHVSTAYAHCNNPSIDERFYRIHENPEEVIDSISKMEDLDEGALM